MNTIADTFVSDREAAEMFGMSRETLRHHCMASHVCRPGTIDVRKAFPAVVGRSRRWSVARIHALLRGESTMR